MAALGALLLAGWPALAQGPVRFSGRVEGIDLGRGVLVVEELAGRGRAVRHEVHLDETTPVLSSSRLRPGAMRGPQAYDEIPVSLADVLVGDFVVIEGKGAGGPILARRVTIVETRPAAR